MNGQLLQIGDEVVIKIEKESREWGYNPCPDGTRAKVLGFGEVHTPRIGNLGFKPGVYRNRCWIKVQLKDGKKHEENHARISLTKKKLEKERSEELRRKKKGWEQLRNEDFLRPLPETTFWEHDVVLIKNKRDAVFSGPVVVQLIDYTRLNELITPDRKWPVYQVSPTLYYGCSVAYGEDQLELVRRGKVWKFFHEEPVKFDDILDEAKFFVNLGHYDEVPNPWTKNYGWTRIEVLEAAEKGIVHGLRLVGISQQISAIKFRNAKLGRRVAQATLKGLEL